MSWQDKYAAVFFTDDIFYLVLSTFSTQLLGGHSFRLLQLNGTKVLISELQLIFVFVYWV